MTMEIERPLAKGQVWVTQAANIEIVALGKTLIHYRIMSHIGQKRVSAQISGIQAMENYLKAHVAKLVKGAVKN